MVAVFAGRRIDADGAEKKSFPLENAKAVFNRIAEILKTKKISTVICSAACGTDLLVLHAARELNVRSIIVLPFKAEIFKIRSVTDRPSAPDFDWTVLFENSILHSTVQVMDLLESDESAYYKVTDEMIRLAAFQGIEETTPVLAGIVWDQIPRDKDDYTLDLKTKAKKYGFEVVQINTLQP